jgi:hypothetical protein
MEPNNQNSYDFIMNPDQKKTAGPNFVGPQKLLMIVGLIAVVIVAIVVLFSVVFSGGASTRAQLVSVNAHQIELARVLGLGLDKTVDQKLKQQFQTLSTTLFSDTQGVSSLMASREYTITKLEKDSQKDVDIDEALDAAEAKNDFDPAFEQAVASTAGEYLEALQSASASVSSAKDKELLNTAIANIETVAQ